MTTAPTQLRARHWLAFTSVSVKFTPVLLVVGVLVSVTNAEYADPYWLDLSSKATVGVIFLGPGYAALGAWDAARLARLSQAAVRRWWRLLLRHVLVVAAGSALTYLVTLLILWAQLPPQAGWPRLDVVATVVLLTAAYGAFGFTVGRFVSGLVGVPISFVLVWLWVAYTPAVQPFWLRNVTGFIGTSCCSMDMQLAGPALLAPTIVGVGVLTGCVVVSGARARLIRVIGGVVVLTIGIGAAGYLVRDVGPDPVVDRTGAQRCVSASTGDVPFTLCAWPERVTKLQRYRTTLADAAAHLRAAGLPVPATLRETTPAGVLGWSFNLGGDNDGTIRKAFATSILADFPPPCVNDNGGTWPANRYFDSAGAWLETTAGVSPAEAARDNSARLPRLHELLATPRSAQLAWFMHARTAMQTCDPIG